MVRSVANALSRARGWWRDRPLGTVFVAYLAAYLALATAGTAMILSLVDAGQDVYYTIELSEDGRGSVRAIVENGPYIYDALADELIPAVELDLPGDNPYAVFVGVRRDVESDRSGIDAAEAAELEADAYPEVDATMDLVRAGKVELYDWGLNYNYRSGFTSEDILDDRGVIGADRIAAYDRRNREGRVDAIALFESATGVDLTQAFGERMVSNVAYYADSILTRSLPHALGVVLNVAAPIVFYGGLAWVMFRRFYRLHIAEPLETMDGAAHRIAQQDLDFELARLDGREFGQLGATMEEMRASLLDAQRELWRTAEERRRLNAAFAHDLRTPVTVLKGTVEMAIMRARRGELADEESLGVLAGQVARLESYTNAMGGLSKLEDRVVERAEVSFDALAGSLFGHARGIVSAKAPDLSLECVRVVQTSTDSGADAPRLFVDMSVVEEVLGNVVGNACGHARAQIWVEVALGDALGGRSGGPSLANVLRVSVRDDGPGFSDEALHRACDPFYSEQKSVEHFGLGLNISSTLAHLHGGGLQVGNAAEGGALVVASFEVGEPASRA